MRRIIIVVEGQTEQEFIKQCVAPYLFDKYGIMSVSARLIGKPGHKGGNARFERLRKDVTIILREPEVVVSMFMNFFKLASDFPDVEPCRKQSNTDAQINCLEQALHKHIGSDLFIPYVQKHEFEALLFSLSTGFTNYLGTKSCKELEAVSQQFPNPEDINSNQPPSYRLTDILNRCEQLNYKKVIYGNIFALEVGIETMITRCERFSNWINKLGKTASHNS